VIVDCRNPRESLTTQREREIAQRNTDNLRRWYTHPQTFGCIVGRVLAEEHLDAIRRAGL
jgi:hypothetical protein